MRDQCGAIFRQARKELESCGLLNEAKASAENPAPGNEESLASDIDKELESLQGKVGPDVITKLEELLVKSQALKHGLARAKRVKMVRSELNKAKKNLANTDSSHSDGENDGGDTKSGSQSSGVSPTGVNRRTAVLFTRKAQAALKKPTEEKEEKEASPPETRPKKKGRPRRAADPAADPKKPNSVPDSFKVYRAEHVSDGEHSSVDSYSTCYSKNESEVASDNESGSDCGPMPDSPDSTAAEKVELKPLQLVWAKCRGYPWYPALIIDPEMPKGHVHKGVPVPSPPSEVMALRANHAEHVYLVLFFDAKRMWQWLPADKLEIMGVDVERDEAKVNEPRKPADRKAVRRAYENAQKYESQVNGPESTEATS